MLKSCKYCMKIHDSKYDCGKKPKRKKQGNDKDKYNSIREASNQTQIAISSIVENCKGKRKTAGGYVWKYEGD